MLIFVANISFLGGEVFAAVTYLTVDVNHVVPIWNIGTLVTQKQQYKKQSGLVRAVIGAQLRRRLVAMFVHYCTPWPFGAIKWKLDCWKSLAFWDSIVLLTRIATLEQYNMPAWWGEIDKKFGIDSFVRVNACNNGQTTGSVYVGFSLLSFLSPSIFL